MDYIKTKKGMMNKINNWECANDCRQFYFHLHYVLYESKSCDGFLNYKNPTGSFVLFKTIHLFNQIILFIFDDFALYATLTFETALLLDSTWHLFKYGQ